LPFDSAANSALQEISRCMICFWHQSRNMICRYNEYVLRQDRLPFEQSNKCPIRQSASVVFIGSGDRWLVHRISAQPIISTSHQQTTQEPNRYSFHYKMFENDSGLFTPCGSVQTSQAT